MAAGRKRFANTVGLIGKRGVLQITGLAQRHLHTSTPAYVSTSQFSREYSRLFGAPPQQDVRRMRISASGGLQEEWSLQWRIVGSCNRTDESSNGGRKYRPILNTLRYLRYRNSLSYGREVFSANRHEVLRHAIAAGMDTCSLSFLRRV